MPDLCSTYCPTSKEPLRFLPRWMYEWPHPGQPAHVLTSSRVWAIGATWIQPSQWECQAFLKPPLSFSKPHTIFCPINIHTSLNSQSCVQTFPFFLDKSALCDTQHILIQRYSYVKYTPHMRVWAEKPCNWHFKISRTACFSALLGRLPLWSIQHSNQDCFKNISKF